MNGPRNWSDISSATQAEMLFRRLRREVWVVMAADGLLRGGLTATWVHPASIDRQRPVVVVGLSSNHHTTTLVQASGRLGGCLLSRAQVGIAVRFAMTSSRDSDKLAGLEVTCTPRNVPRLTDCQAWFEGHVFARLEAGGRTYFWADVTAAQSLFTEEVLYDHDLFAAATPQERQVLSDRLGEDVRVERPRDEAWRTSIASSQGQAQAQRGD